MRRRVARPGDTGARAPYAYTAPRTVAPHRYCSTDEQSLLHTTPTEKVAAAKRGPCQARSVSIDTLSQHIGAPTAHRTALTRASICAQLLAYHETLEATVAEKKKVS